MGASRPSQLIGGYAQVLIEDAPQLPTRQREPACKIILVAIIEHSLDDELNGTTDEFRRVVGDQSRASVRTASQASSESRRFSSGGQLERANILGQRCRRAVGPAVNAGRYHRRDRWHAFPVYRLHEQLPAISGHRLRVSQRAAEVLTA
jgi:hypothetical protein